VPIHKEARLLVNVTAVVLGPKRGYFGRLKHKMLQECDALVL
jgi:hypothetical protein